MRQPLFINNLKVQNLYCIHHGVSGASMLHLRSPNSTADLNLTVYLLLLAPTYHLPFCHGKQKRKPAAFTRFALNVQWAAVTGDELPGQYQT